MTEPHWSNVKYPAIDYQDIIYYSAPKTKKPLGSLDEVDPKLLETYNKLGISLNEQKALAGVAVDAVFDSVSVGTSYKEELAKHGIIFCSFSEAVREHPELVQKYLGSVVPYSDNFFAALNSAVFSDGSFCYIPKGVQCPMELSTYFRINNPDTGQFERTLIVADEGASVSYLEGCTAPKRDTNQLHAAVVELVALDDAKVKYSTVQNWFAGDEEGKGGIYNFVTKRGACRGRNSKISWTQVETGSAITWKYPSVILQGDNSVGEFYSVAVVNNHQQADTGTKMIHIGRNTKSNIVSKGISAGQGNNSYRGQVKILPKAEGARNYTQCDSMLVGNRCGAHTFPYIEVQNNTATLEHEASTSKIGEDQIFYLKQRGLSAEQAVSMIVSGFCKEVFQELPMEFALEAQQLLGITLEGSVG
jgi:Fe-S cluster assembly protein SufB